MSSTTGRMAQHETPVLPGNRSLDVLLCTFGTRGDTQPHIRVVQELEKQGHRVRITVSPSTEALVKDDYGLETYPIGRDMDVFMEFSTLKTPQKMLTMVNGHFKKLKAWQTEMLRRQWAAAIDEGDQLPNRRPFVADAMIASLAGMVHLSVAQRMSIPLIFVQANPRSPTRNWPHSTGNPRATILEPCDENYQTWITEEEKVWTRYYRGIINRIRKKHLGLPPLTSKFWPRDLLRLDIPAVSLVSPSVLPKPDDFPDHSIMAGYSFPEINDSFQPEPALVEFLANSSKDKPTIYVDFGSRPHLDKRALTTTILAAVRAAGVRAVIRRLWYVGGPAPPDVYVAGDMPHSWLLPKVSLIVHSCGAGITGISLRCGTPTAPVPMEADQYLFAKRLKQLEAGPGYVSMHDITTENLTALMKEALDPKYRAGAEAASRAIAAEPDGAQVFARHWHNHMLETKGFPTACSVLPDRNAVWTVRGRPDVHLSVLAAHVLDAEKALSYGDLDLLKVVDWDRFAFMKPRTKSRDPATDLVRQRRVEQGAWDFGKLPKPENGIATANGEAEGTLSGKPAGLHERGRDSVVKETITRWNEISAAKPN